METLTDFNMNDNEAKSNVASVKGLEKQACTSLNSECLLMEELYESQKSNYLLTKQLERCQECNLNILEELTACQLANSILREELEKVYRKLAECQRKQKYNEDTKTTRQQFKSCEVDLEYNYIRQKSLKKKESVDKSKVCRPDSGYDTVSDTEEEYEHRQLIKKSDNSK